ncbi:MAG: tRNA (adenosine(37)-N6)-threonylcarbamoyltransferase complex ATPase subunit type 1 TsaE [Candidatus Bipolaricaulota bacterium]
MQTFKSGSPEDTERIGEKLVKDLGTNLLICLYGPLAAGKTTLVKGLAGALGIEETIVSPSYVLLREYEGGSKLFHLDLFRIQSSQEFLEAGLDEYLLLDEGVVAIEWADRIEEVLPEERLDMELELTGEEQRKVKLTSYLEI